MHGRHKGTRLNGSDRAEIRHRIAQGETFAAAAAAIGCSTKSIQRLLNVTGGMASRAVERSPLRLSLAEREEISRGLENQDSLRTIARSIARAPSTISREVFLAGGRDRYRAWIAERCAAKRARRPKPLKLASNEQLRQMVETGLGKQWSPQQISSTLKRENPMSSEKQVSAETIYKSLYVQTRGSLRKELRFCLRQGKMRRQPQKRLNPGGNLLDMIMISKRPPEIEDRAVPGHWEGDLIIGKNGDSAVGTLVERHSRYVMLVHLPNGRTAPVVRKALAETIKSLPEHIRRSVTWDQGKEMAEHKLFSLQSKMQVYFCDPRSPWQRGSNENTNGLLRQYLPKGDDLSRYKKRQLNAIAKKLNERPRKTLDWSTPAEVFARSVAMTP